MMKKLIHLYVLVVMQMLFLGCNDEVAGEARPKIRQLLQEHDEPISYVEGVSISVLGNDFQHVNLCLHSIVDSSSVDTYSPSISVEAHSVQPNIAKRTTVEHEGGHTEIIDLYTIEGWLDIKNLYIENSTSKNILIDDMAMLGIKSSMVKFRELGKLNEVSFFYRKEF